MTSTDLSPARPALVSWPAAVAAFLTASGLSAFLLFAVQPMFAKMTLPILGGAPAVWSVAMAFFQALLLAGYAYAHLLTKTLPVRSAAIVHLLVFACAFAMLPIAVASDWGRPPADGEAFWLIGLFFVSVGLPFFAVSANGPLLQAWYAASGRPGSQNPYFLYAASNAGSFGALVAYPLVIEPFVTLKAQSLVWTVGFCALAGCIALAGFLARDGRAAPASKGAAIAMKERLAWVGLAFVPSGLLVAVTAHISTDVAVIPLLWTAPLALFLLTFVLAFRTQPLVSQRTLAVAQAWLTAATLLSFVFDWPMLVELPLHLALLFSVAMTAHSALYARRPPAGDLTLFYLCMSLGGVLGGAFCSLLAPVLFNRVLEYPILLVLALACIPTFAWGAASLRRTGLALGAAVLIVGAGAALVDHLGFPAALTRLAFVLAASAPVALLWRRPEAALPYAAAAAIACIALMGATGRGETVRSFFGVHKLTTTEEGRFLLLSHGTTIHGAARLKTDEGAPYDGPPEPTTYYTPEGALGRAIAATRAAQGGMLDRVGVIGLGSGSLACHRGAGEDWRFFEIDSSVETIARNRFRFLKSCAPDAPVVLGDARLTIADEPKGLSLIVVDAFSSDAIPVHLMTREALELYVSKLGSHGAVLLHVSNRHLDLSNILARAGAELGLKAYFRRESVEEPFERRMRAPVRAVLLARDPADAGPIAADPNWTPVVPDMARKPWTDDFSNVLEAMWDARAR